MADEAAERLAYVRGALTEFRRRCREDGYAWPMTLEAALAVASGARDRQGTTELALSTVDGNPLAMTYGTAAARLSVSERTVQRLVAAGALPAVDVGGCPRIREADLQAFVDRLPTRRVA